MKPSVGPTSILGWTAAAGALVVSIAQSLEAGVPLFTHASGTSAKIAAALTIAVGLGRQYQAAHLPGSEDVGKALDQLPPGVAGVPVLPAPPLPDVGDGAAEAEHGSAQ